MSGAVTPAMTAATVLVKRGLTADLKEQALELAKLYSGNVQIQIDIKQDSNTALMRITEYNI